MLFRLGFYAERCQKSSLRIIAREHIALTGQQKWTNMIGHGLPHLSKLQDSSRKFVLDRDKHEPGHGCTNTQAQQDCQNRQQAAIPEEQMSKQACENGLFGICRES